MIVLGEYHTTCDHGQPAHTCASCRDERASSAVDLIVATLFVVGFLLAGVKAFDREVAGFEAEQQRQHLERLERAQPGARERLREIAAEQRAIGGLR